jgi:hypothetical protein
MIALLKYNYKIHIKENKFMVPLLIYLFFHAVFYSTGTEKFVPGVIVCASVVFCIMAWMGFAYSELQDSRTEQIVFLKINNQNKYWISKIVFMFSVGIIVSIVGVVWPLVRSFSNDDISVNNFILGFFILILAAFMGTLIGMIFQTKVIGNRNKALLIVFLIIIVAIVKIPIGKEYPIAKVVTWILPPINNITNSCIGVGSFSLSLLVVPIICSIVYIILEIFIYIRLMKKILF